MNPDFTGMLLRSEAGHDRGKLYVALSEDSNFLYLTDGKLKSVSAPKRKNRLHVSRILMTPFRERLLSGETVRDEEIKRFIRLYMKEKQSREESEGGNHVES